MPVPHGRRLRWTGHTTGHVLRRGVSRGKLVPWKGRKRADHPSAASGGQSEGAFGFLVKVSFELERCSVDALAADVAVATGVFRGAGEDASGKPVKVRSAFTFVLHRLGHDWKIRHGHESSLE